MKLELALKAFIEDLEFAESELRLAVFDNNDLKFHPRLSSIRSTISYLKDITSGFIDELENQNAQNAPSAPKAQV